MVPRPQARADVAPIAPSLGKLLGRVGPGCGAVPHEGSGGVPVARRCRKGHGFAPPCRPAPSWSIFVSDFAKNHDFWVVFECQIPTRRIPHPLAPQVRGGENAAPQNRPSENYTKVGKSWQNRDPKWTKRPGRTERRPAARTAREELAHTLRRSPLVSSDVRFHRQPCAAILIWCLSIWLDA